jgi:hypothetical protein
MVKKLCIAAFLLTSLSAHAGSKNFNYDLYGFVKSSYIYADQKVESYGANGVGAITNAGLVNKTNSATQKADESSRFAFQAQQSRFGFKIDNNKGVKGRLEFDFIDFGAMAPSPDYDIRLRIAMIDWQLSKSLTLQAGQKWVSVMGVLPHTYNYVQSNFRSGNTGFIMQEAALKYSVGSFDLIGAFSSRGRNQGNGGAGVTERGALPAVTLRADYKHGAGILGVSGMVATLKGESDSSNTANNYHDGTAYIAKLYGSFKSGSFDLRAEAYTGQNTGNLFMLAAEDASFEAATGKNIKVHGGFVSAKVGITDTSGIYAGYGTSITNDGEKYVANDKMIENSVITVGIDKRTDSGLTVFLEAQSFDSKFHTSNQETESADAMTIETGMVYKF